MLFQLKPYRSLNQVNVLKSVLKFNRLLRFWRRESCECDNSCTQPKNALPFTAWNDLKFKPKCLVKQGVRAEGGGGREGKRCVCVWGGGSCRPYLGNFLLFVLLLLQNIVQDYYFSLSFLSLLATLPLLTLSISASDLLLSPPTLPQKRKVPTTCGRADVSHLSCA